MLAFLEGDIAFVEADPEAVLLKVGGVGYRLSTSRPVGKVGDRVTLHVAEVIREDRFDLYGFLRREELTFFHRLTMIDGVGPKMALKILAAGTFEELQQRIQRGDLAFLTTISGVGKKTAQKIILELQGALVTAPSDNPADSEVVQALLGLGYARGDIDAALPQVMGETTEERVKSALQKMSRV